jgi:transposase
VLSIQRQFKRGRYDYDIPVVRQLGFARRLALALHAAHHFQPFNAFRRGPLYFPELNLNETVWSYVKHHVVGKKIITGPERFLRVVKAALYSLLCLT